MIELFLTRPGRLLAKVPREVWYIAAAVAAWFIVTGHYYSKGYDARTGEYEALISEQEAKAVIAGQSAQEAAQATVSAIEADNERAKEAAAECDDILKCGLDAL